MSNSSRPLLLVSNDDGHASYFLRALVDALCLRYEVCVVAPLEEQSWVGRAMTRSGVIEARELEGWPCPAWSVSGRPADCVNLGINHLLPRRPDAVISGMNLGFNASLPLILGSGTVAAATEGAFAGLPAIAFSLAIEHQHFAEVSAARGHRDEAGDAITRRAAARALELTEHLLSEPQPAYSVHNINFPPTLTEDAPVTHTEATQRHIPSLFKQVDSPKASLHSEESASPSRHYTFSFASRWEHTHDPEDSDLNAVRRGEISHTLLRWSQISSLPL